MDDIPSPPGTQVSQIGGTSPPQPTQPAVKKSRTLTILIGIFVLLVGIILGAFLTQNKRGSSSAPLPYKYTAVVTSPKQKLEQVIAHNIIFTQLNTLATPVYAVDETHNDPMQTLLTVKSSLDESATLNIKRRTTVTATGKLSSTPDTTPQDFSLKAALMTLTNQKNEQVITDMIVNGSFGNAQLQDETQDAFHLSLTQTNPNDSYLKINMSDYLLIFVNRMMHPNQPASPQITVQTNDIWPFLGQYLHIPKSLEAVRFGSDLPDTDKQKLDTIRNETDTLFSQTLGNVPSYADITTPATPASDSATTVTAQIIPNKLNTVLTSYLTGLQTIKTQHKTEMEAMCRDSHQTQQQADTCLAQLNEPMFTSDETQASVSAMLSTLTFSPIVASINPADFSIRKLSADVTFTNTKTASSTAIWNVPIPLSSIIIHIDTEEESRTDTNAIVAPPAPVELIAAADNTKSFTDDSYQEQSIQGALYRENKNNLLTTAYTSSSNYCAGLPSQEYCIDAPEVWLEFASSQGPQNTLSLTKKNLDPNDYHNTSVMITQSTTSTTPIQCVYDHAPGEYGSNMVNYKDLTTKDSVTLRISEPENLLNSDTVYYDACVTSNGKYYQTSPYGTIVINPGSLTFEKTLEAVAPILSSLRWKNPGTSSSIKVVLPTPLPTASYGFDKPPVRLKSGDTSFMYLYGAGSPGTPGVCNVGSDYLELQYKLDPDTMIVVPNGFGYCLSQNLCDICTNGNLGKPTSDLSSCKNQPCNP